jgi:methyl-accepting chemotaxis protein
MKISDLKIGVRLGTGIAILLVLMAIMAGISLSSLARSDDAADQMQKAMRRAQLTAEWEGLLDSHAEMMAPFLRSNESADRKRIEAKAIAQTRRGDEISQELSSLSDDSGKQMLAAIRAKAAQFRDARKAALEMKDRNNPDDAAALNALVTDKVLPSMQAYTSVIHQFGDQSQAAAHQATQDAKHIFSLGQSLLIGFGLAALVLGTLLGWLLTRGITRPIARAVRIAGTVASGDLAQRIETSSGDETGQLLRAMRDMSAKLATTVSHIRAGAQAISSAASQIAIGNTDLSSRTEQQAASLEETAASMEQLASTVKQNADNARQANQLAASASDVAMRGGAAVSEVVGTMNEIAASSRKISEIVSVIDGIAFQTNILALNAAVEAARAGEQGKGFAVVAGEVRTLAQRSAQAAKEIKVLIEDSVGKVNIGSNQVERAGSTMQEIVASVKRVTDIMGEIATASEEQAGGIDQINRAVSQMDEVTQQNATLVEEATTAAGTLQDEADRLMRSVGVFKIASSRHAGEQYGAAHDDEPLEPTLLPASAMIQLPA